MCEDPEGAWSPGRVSDSTYILDSLTIYLLSYLTHTTHDPTCITSVLLYKYNMFLFCFFVAFIRSIRRFEDSITNFVVSMGRKGLRSRESLSPYANRSVNANRLQGLTSWA